MDRELKLKLTNAFLEGYLQTNKDTFMADMLKIAKSSVEFELETMAGWNREHEFDDLEFPEDW